MELVEKTEANGDSYRRSRCSYKCSRIIIIVVQVGAPKIYVAAVDALRKKERYDETQFATKVDGFWSFTSCGMLMYFLVAFFESHLVYDQTQGSGAVSSLHYY
jgi:hypothetical protein